MWLGMGAQGIGVPVVTASIPGEPHFQTSISTEKRKSVGVVSYTVLHVYDAACISRKSRLEILTFTFFSLKQKTV